ncbi:sulfite exporter TauE/SafE family protein [Symmachiella dynata]|uniref:Nickel/cobalt efflux system n=1 Tax=Symmachiella dynata TaxID=2527995 RepID=A0A517ZY13_9PLAN|nr:sulfite exporter TauE/SafE family protein [Symmachiella dynata]QDT51648.1 Nickel/cobalt efflux system RcnA [Symmachiella dynata]QDU47345.1 Nickel/cobalt efflux system RcnA [Symmachiella dynata]
MHNHAHDVTLGLAFLLGAFHALEPGHGKTAMFVYLLGGRRSPWHPFVMGISTAFSHSMSLFAIAFAVHLAHHVVTGDHHHEDQISTILPWISALLVVAVGCYLVWQAYRGKQVRCCGHHHHSDEHHHDCDSESSLVQLGSDSPKALEPAAPRTSYKTTALLGMAVGLLPCPSALAAYFTGLSTGSPVAAYLIIALFAAGIASSLTLVGLVLQLFGDRLGNRVSGASRIPWAHVRAFLILGMGAFYTVRLVVSST